MGLSDFIRRRRLTQQGMSSGRKRRTADDAAVAHRLDRNAPLRFAIYGCFGVVLAMLVANAPAGSWAFGHPAPAVLVVLLGLIMALVAFETSFPKKARLNGQVLLLFGGLALHLALALAASLVVTKNNFDDALKLLVIPFAFAPIVHGILLGTRTGIFSAFFVSIFGCFLVPEKQILSYLMVSLLCGLTGVYVTRNLRKRGRLLRAGLYVGAVALVTALAFDAIEVNPLLEEGGSRDWQLFAINSAVAFGCGFITAMVISALLPLLEGVFAITTDISWLELSDLNHKLLRRMQLEAPGTFHHSMVVASLAEAAAESIGAHAMICRVSAYFHDIGKLNKPEYFIENQGEHNPHDDLTPTMSALIIVAHVKDGVDMALKHKLNPRIIDAIREHHGDSLVYYFYRKAQEQLKESREKVDAGIQNPEDLPEVDEKSFRYPGPRPRTRESGIVSLADAIESASRSLKKPTPAKVSALVDEIVFTRIRDGQLDYCGLTVSDLRKVRKSFATTLRSMLHSRIEYPQAGKPEHLEEGREQDAQITEDAASPEKTGQSGSDVGNVVPVEEVERARRKASGRP